MNDVELRVLNSIVGSALSDKKFQALTAELQLDLEPNAEAKIQAILDELHRRFSYRPDPIEERFEPVPFVEGACVDVDDACMFAATIAKLAGVRCRFVYAEYKRRCWTMRVAYESNGFWTVVDVLRQSYSDHLRFNQMIIGEEIR